MENYQIQQRLFNQCGHETFLVSRIVDGIKKDYILKKLECKDENSANQAYRELLYQKEALEEIAGSIPMLEFHIYWETKNSSIHICCFREIYEVNLVPELNTAYIKYSVVKEKLVKNYLTQLILIVEKCHNKNLFHREIKLSNVAKHKEMGYLQLVDFTIKGTTDYNCQNVWQAPELGIDTAGTDVVKPPDKEKIDVWGIGVVILSVVTSVFVEPGAKFESFLRKMKDNFDYMEDMVERLYLRYSRDLITILRKMVWLDPKKRPTIKDLKKEEHLETAFEINDTNEIIKDFHKSKITSFWSLQKNDDIDKIFLYLSTFIDCEDRVTIAFVTLNKLFVCQNSLDVKSHQKEVVLKSMKNHLSLDKIQNSGFQLLTKLISQSPIKDYLFTCDAVCKVIYILQAIPINGNLKSILYEYFTHLSLSDSAAQSFGSHGGLHIFIELFKQDLEDPFMLEKGSRALWGLCTQVSNAKIAAAHGIPADMCACLQRFSENIEVTKELVAVIFSLSPVPNVIHVYCQHNVIHHVISFLRKNAKKPEIITLCCNTLKSFIFYATFYDNVLGCFRKNNVIDLLVSILWDYFLNPEMIRICINTLSAIIVDHEESTYSFLITNNRDVTKNSGMKLIKKIANHHKTNLELIRLICDFLNIIMKYEEGCHHVKSYNIHLWLTDIKHRFFKNKDLHDICEMMLKRLKKITGDD